VFALCSASTLAASAAFSASLALMASPFAFDSASAISPALFVVDTPYYGVNEDGWFPITVLFLVGMASPPSIDDL